MPVELIEELIQEENRTIALAPGSGIRSRLSSSRTSTLSRLLRPGARDLENQQRLLTGQRQKLLDAHYAGAIPMDLLKFEQDRITGQLGHIAATNGGRPKYYRARQNLSDCLDITRDCHAAYLEDE